MLKALGKCSFWRLPTLLILSVISQSGCDYWEESQGPGITHTANNSVSFSNICKHESVIYQHLQTKETKELA